MSVYGAYKCTCTASECSYIAHKSTYNWEMLRAGLLSCLPVFFAQLLRRFGSLLENEAQVWRRSAENVGASAWGFGPGLALPLALINVLESVIGAMLLRRLAPRRSVLESQRWLLVFVLAAGVVAPAVSAILATITLTIATDQLPLQSLINWYSGHALGTLTFMPIFMLVLRGDALRLIRQTTKAQLSQATVLLAFTSAISVVSFAQYGLPLLFLPLLPMVLATFRGGPLSTAASIVMLAVAQSTRSLSRG